MKNKSGSRRDHPDNGGHSKKLRKDNSLRRASPKKEQRRKPIEKVVPKIDRLVIPEYGITIANLGVLLGVPHSIFKPPFLTPFLERFARTLQRQGFSNVESDLLINSEMAGIIAEEFGLTAVDPSSQDTGPTLSKRPPPESWEGFPPRAPVVTIMGHVDRMPFNSKLTR